MKILILSRIYQYVKRLYQARKIRKDNEKDMTQKRGYNEIGCTNIEVNKS